MSSGLHTAFKLTMGKRVLLNYVRLPIFSSLFFLVISMLNRFVEHLFS